MYYSELITYITRILDCIIDLGSKISGKHTSFCNYGKSTNTLQIFMLIMISRLKHFYLSYNKVNKVLEGQYKNVTTKYYIKGTITDV